MKKRRLFFGLVFIIVQSLLTAKSFAANSSTSTEEAPLTGTATISSYELEPQQPFNLEIKLHLPDDYRAYGDKFKLDIESEEKFSFKKFDVQPLHEFFDEVTKKTKKGMIKDATLTAHVEAPLHLSTGEHTMKIQLSYQACTASFCLFPTKFNIEIPFRFKNNTDQEKSISAINNEIFNLNFDQAMKKSLFWAFFITFIAGFLTSLTPCVFPMIPITVAVLGRNAHLHSKRKNFLLSILYVLGISVTYAAAGIFAAATGSMFGSMMSHPFVLTFIVILFLTMALSMFGLFDLQAPAFLRKRLAGDLHLHGYRSAFVYGVIAGVVASPCVGPVLVGILTFVAKSQNLWLGFWLLFIFSLGMGVLFLIIGFSSQATKLLPKSGRWMNGVKYLFGIILLGAAFYYARLLFPKDSHIVQTQTSIDWQLYSEKNLEKAKQEHRPILIDAWAEWCGACLELESKTFSAEEFKSIAKKFTLMKVDFTNDNETNQKFKSQYKIVGLPYLILINSKGEWLEDLTTTEFIDASALSQKMQKTLESSR